MTGDRYHYYQGFRFELTPVYEDTEKRAARGDYKSRIIGWKFSVQESLGTNRWQRMKYESPEYESPEAAISAAEGGIDAIIDSL